MRFTVLGPVSVSTPDGQVAVEAPKQRLLLAEPLLPGSSAALVLLTSRRRLAGLDVTRQLQLDVLPPAEAVALFWRLADLTGPDPAETELVTAITELCGRLHQLELGERGVAAAFTMSYRDGWTTAPATPVPGRGPLFGTSGEAGRGRHTRPRCRAGAAGWPHGPGEA